MPMPKLLKKLSRKSLKGAESEHESESEAPPPLPLTEYDSLDEDGSRSFSPAPRRRLKSSASNSPRPSSDWLSRSASASALETLTHNGSAANGNGRYAESLPPRSRQNSQADFLVPESGNSRASYAPPSDSPPPRGRTTSYGGSRSGSFTTEDSRARVYSPSQLSYQATTITSMQPSASPSPMTPEHASVPDDDLSRDLAGAWQIANTAPKQSKADKLLQTAGESHIFINSI